MSTKPQQHSKFSLQLGFTLLELLLVLGIISVMAAVILPNLSITSGSQMSAALRDFTGALRSSYDSAVLTGKVHRMVLQPKTGAYWTEEAPAVMTGRPPVVVDERADQKAEERVRWLEDLNQAAADPRKADDGKRVYTNRSILVVQRKIFTPLRWTEVDDSMLTRRTLPGQVVFVSARTPAMPEKLEYTKVSEKETAVIYFFPSGEAQQASIQFGVLKDAATIDESGPKQTVVLESLSGQSQIIEGFYEVDFK